MPAPGNHPSCPECGEDALSFMAELVFEAPMHMWHRITRTAIKKKEFKIWGVHWDRVNIHCNECGYSLFKMIGESDEIEFGKE